MSLHVVTHYERAPCVQPIQQYIAAAFPKHPLRSFRNVRLSDPRAVRGGGRRDGTDGTADIIAIDRSLMCLLSKGRTDGRGRGRAIYGAIA